MEEPATVPEIQSILKHGLPLSFVMGRESIELSIHL